MNEIIKIHSAALPNAQQPQLPIRIDFEHPMGSYPPEFWLSIPTDKQKSLMEEFENNGLEYLIYKLSDTAPPKSIAVCRGLSFRETEAIVIEICRKLFIDDFIVSDGGLSSVDVNGDLQGFICFD